MYILGAHNDKFLNYNDLEKNFRLDHFFSKRLKNVIQGIKKQSSLMLYSELNNFNPSSPIFHLHENVVFTLRALF